MDDLLARLEAAARAEAVRAPFGEMVRLLDEAAREIERLRAVVEGQADHEL